MWMNLVNIFVLTFSNISSWGMVFFTNTFSSHLTARQRQRVFLFFPLLRSSRLQMFFKIGVLKNFAIFTGKRKHLCWSLFLSLKPCNFIKIRLHRKCSKFFRKTPFNSTSLVAACDTYYFYLHPNQVPLTL